MSRPARTDGPNRCHQNGPVSQRNTLRNQSVRVAGPVLIRVVIVVLEGGVR